MVHIKASIQGFSLAESHMSGEGVGGGGGRNIVYVRMPIVAT